MPDDYHSTDGHPFLRRTQGEFLRVLPSSGDVEQYIKRLKDAKKKATDPEKKWLIKQTIKELKILKEQLQ